MSFLPATLSLIPLTITTLVVILCKDELRVFAVDNSDTDTRFAFEDSNCLQSWKGQLESELERPSLELWTKNGTKMLDRPSPTIIHMGEEYQVENDRRRVTVKMMCRAPYPVILLAALQKQIFVENQGDEFHVTTTNIYNKSSYNFETHTRFYLLLDPIIANVYYCQAVHNPCIKSREKLLFFNDSGADAMSFTLRYYSFASGSNSSNSDSDSKINSNSTLLNANSSSISTSEFQSIFGTKWNLYLNQSLTFWNSSTKDQEDDEDRNNENNTDSECEAFFYYEEFLGYSNRRKGQIHLRYFCEFSDGTPGTHQVYQECGKWGRCQFLLAANKPKVKNCWRPYIPEKTCMNCTAQTLLLWYITEPFIPYCRTFLDRDKLDGEDVFLWSGETFRYVQGTPLYVGYPPPGFEIQRPYIRTDAYDRDDLEESTLVRMKPFPEIQLFNTTIQITCESNELYTSKIFIFALELQSERAKGKRVQKKLQFFPVDKTALELRYYGKGVLNSQTLTIHLNRTDLNRIFCFAAVQNSYQWINSSRPIRVLEYRDFYKPSECLGENDKNSDSNIAQKLRPKFSMWADMCPEFPFWTENSIPPCLSRTEEERARVKKWLVQKWRKFVSRFGGFVHNLRN